MKLLLIALLIIVSPFCAVASHSDKGGQVTIDQQEMTQVLNDYLARESRQFPQVDLRFKSLDLPDAYTIPQGRVDHQVIPANPGVIGSRRMTLLTRVDGEVVSNQSLRVDLEAMAEVVVARESMRRGKLLGANDIEIIYMDISKLDEPIFAAEKVVGKQLKRSVRLGDPLEKQEVEFPPVIKRGEKVVINASGLGLQLSAAGEARQDGRAGEMIRVVNSSSHKVVMCKVVAPGLVTVEF